MLSIKQLNNKIPFNINYYRGIYKLKEYMGFINWSPLALAVVKDNSANPGEWQELV